MRVLSEAGQQRIEQLIAQIEQRTAAEFVVLCVARSDDYADVRFAWALLAALGSALGVHFARPDWSIRGLLWVEFSAALVAYLALGVPALLRLATPKARAQHSVERRAQLGFLQHGVFATRDRSGVLILLSELERRVAILGDEGIHAHIQSDGWRAHVQHMLAEIRAGRAEAGICDVLRALEGVLREKLPPRSDDTNELPNAVRREPR